MLCSILRCTSILTARNNYSSSSIISSMKYKSSLLGLGIIIIMLNSAWGQVQTARYISTGAHSKAFYEYLPSGYPAAGVKYPLLIFIHGMGELGPGTSTSLPLVLRNGPPKLINNGTFPQSFSVAGQTFKFIVISPQFTEWPYGPDVESVITYAKNNYPVDINRIYLTGLSMGGGTVWNYAGGTLANASKLAAIVPVAGASDPYSPFAANMANADLPVWATHNSGDGTVPVANTNTYINMINTAPNPPSPTAKKTIFTANSHDAWTQTYNPNYRENGLNVYEWMLQYKRNFNVLPVTGLEFNAAPTADRKVQLQWTTVSEINARGFSILRSADGINFSSIGFINSAGINGGGSNYSFTDAAPLPGKSFYRLQLTDADNQFSLSDIRMIEVLRANEISFFPNPAQTVLNIKAAIPLINAQLRISNAAGQNVVQQQLHGAGNFSINVASLTPGIYYGKIV
ncbi:MAG: T9SS type A sorting domain-containing protein, partial [Sphingobacteriales bacterium]